MKFWLLLPIRLALLIIFATLRYTGHLLHWIAKGVEWLLEETK